MMRDRDRPAYRIVDPDMMTAADAIIAATARKNNLTLLTADDHFKKSKAPWKVRFYKPI